MSDTTYQDLCLVERILQKRVDQETGAVEYLIRWQGTDAQGNEYENTWEPEHNILGDELIDEFEQRQGSKRQHRQRSPGEGQDGAQRGLVPISSSIGGQSHSLQGMTHNSSDQHSLLPLGYIPSPPYMPPFGHPNFPGPRQFIQNFSPYNTRTKRKLPSVVNNDHAPEAEATPETNSTSQQSSNKDSTLLGNTKRQKKSVLVKDPVVRKEMVRFLRDPKYPGLVEGARLLESDTWLIELKEQKGSSGSLFLALDILKGEVKALFIPEWMLEHQRKIAPGQGIVLKDKTVVSAIMGGDLHGSGLYPSENEITEEPNDTTDDNPVASIGPTESNRLPVTLDSNTGSKQIQQPSTSNSSSATEAANISTTEKEPIQQQDDQTPLPSSLSGSPKYQSEMESDISMKEEDQISSSHNLLLHCEWKDCQQTRTTIDELTKHVLQDHLQALFATSSLSSKTSPINTEVAVSALAEDSSWQARYELSQVTYQSLQDQIARTKDIALKMDQKIHESRILYTSAVARSKENIKRLEAHLEWEMKKWNKYQEQKNKMTARLVDPDGSSDSHKPKSESNDDIATSVLGDLEDINMDKPMEAQSINTIRDIQKTLAAAKDDLARLEEDNMALFEKRRALDNELKTLDEQFQQTVSQLAELKAKEHSTREEIKTRSQSIEEYKVTMEREQEKTRQVVSQLQSMIESMKKSGIQSTSSNNSSTSTTALNSSEITPISNETPSKKVSNSNQTSDNGDTTPSISNFISLLTTNVNGDSMSNG
ncbi:hypothetical protein BGZ76_000965 [Entomortierella beljakovae]|nr:hypothetical protein BGZ76_000965 [Entomortierella beljakovae]